MVSFIISRLVILVFGTLYPAYASYKAVKTRNVKEYVKWMMYWIVFALFTCIETVSDIFASLIPCYYEAKILFIFWLLSPWTKGASYLYRKFIHPTLSKREKEIDEYIATASDKGYETLKRVSKNGLTIAANAFMTSAIKGQTTILDQIRVYTNSPEKGHEDENFQKDELSLPNEVDNRVIEEQQSQPAEKDQDVAPSEESRTNTRRRRRRDLNKELDQSDSNKNQQDNESNITMKRYNYGHYAAEGSVKQYAKRHQELTGSKSSSSSHHSTRATRSSTRSLHS
ncbi:receptor expression-enhancing protein 1-like [Saccoglossus kowalevskii]|uniref:Receptor expression-enhancing protein n=1 Tax=Saccoglossus kowalevskii TaxID=10224 RepID=A0ABM0N101_SACKO|nr:PREDICTED: receptor expression-enhancing protein 2-like [Saccoglossus kowalevskii]